MNQSKHQIESLWRQTRSVATWFALVTISVLIVFRGLSVNAYIRLPTDLINLVFPSGDVTITKVLWLLLGLALAAFHLNDMLSRCRPEKALSGHRLYLVDQFCPSSRVPILISGNASTQVNVESPHFQGQVDIRTTCQRVGLHLQGHFRRTVAIESQVCFALEFRVETKGCKWLANMARRVVSMVYDSKGMHFAQGEDDRSHLKLPYLALSMLPCENAHYGVDFSRPSSTHQATSYAIGHIYGFEASISSLKWRYLLKFGLVALEWLPVNWIALPSIHLVAYLVASPSMQGQQTLTKSYCTTKKRYLFCYRIQNCTHTDSRTESQRLRVLLPSKDQSLDVEVGSPIALYTTSEHRRCGVPRAHAEACRQIAVDARALGKLRLSLDVWVEFVDRVAGRRKVGYLVEVVNTTQQSRRTVMRSAVTVKNAVLLLRMEHQIDRKETELENEEDDSNASERDETNESIDFQNLSVESREYRYEQIEHETSAVARVLDQIASKVSKKRYPWRPLQACYQNQLEKATLYRCLMSPSRLPSVPSYQAIGVQINEQQLASMNVVCETGIYRLHGAGDGTTSLLRQEWFIVSTDNLYFFRSYTVSPCLSIPVTNVLNVCSIDHVSLLQGNQPMDMHHALGAIPRWFCVEIHFVFEIITLFVETSAERDHLVASLQPLTIDDCNYSKGVQSEAIAASSLFTPMVLETQSQPVCLNQRTSRFVNKIASDIDAVAALKLVQESLQAGLTVFALGELAGRLRINRSSVLNFVDKVEKLNCLDLDKVARGMTSEDRFALGLNLYHTLFTHAVLVFGYPQTHEQWKLVQTVPCYLMRVNGANESVRYTLADIQRVILRCPVPVNLEASSLKRNLSQHAFMDVAIGGGDAINGLCRAVLGIAWTPVLPSSSSYALIKTTPRPISATLAIDHADFRTSLVLQINSTPPIPKTRGIMRVYSGGIELNDQLSFTCTTFLRRELRLNEVDRIISLPRVCKWYRIGYQHEADGPDDSSRMSQLTHSRRRRSSSGSGVAALPTSRGFFCLQRLLGYMEVEQHHRAMHLLLGAGDECRFVYREFWTRPSRSVAANLLTSAGNAALLVLTSVTYMTGGTSSREGQDYNAARQMDDVGQRTYF